MITDIKQGVIHWAFERYMAWRLEELVRPGYPVVLDYPIDPVPRYGYGSPPHPEIARLLDSRHATFREMLDMAGGYVSELLDATTFADDDTLLPAWNNRYFGGIDGVMLYGLMRQLKPRVFLEIGSGNSTRFAFKAKADGKLPTRIVSVDPSPRAEIDRMCDVVVRQPLEKIDVAQAADLHAGDILFIDSSHRVYTNSDVTVCFLEVLPRLRPGVWVHLHDIFLPFDYPPLWAKRHYSEQYLLACVIQANETRYRVQHASAYASVCPQLASSMNAFSAHREIAASIDLMRTITEGYAGVSVWLEIQ
ncbi:MAG TPA: class I SAM-dependent methyltransferase [Burkholderiales bacterium]|nr:class I SAM-dependent methyltransferase [Burkholderiales bacterium]